MPKLTIIRNWQVNRLLTRNAHQLAKLGFVGVTASNSDNFYRLSFYSRARNITFSRLLMRALGE